MEIKNRYVIIAGVLLFAGIIGILLIPQMAVTPALATSPYSFSYSLHPDGLTRSWDAVVAGEGFDENTTELDHFSAEINPDNTVRHLSLDFYATKDGVDRRYSIIYSNRSGDGGTTMVYSNLVNNRSDTGTNTVTNQTPRQILKETEQTDFSVLGMAGHNISISTGKMTGNASYESGTGCTEIYVYGNKSLRHAAKISGVMPGSSRFMMTFSVMNCTYAGPEDGNCVSERSVDLFTFEDLTGSEIVYDAQDAPATWRTCSITNRSYCESNSVCMFGHCYTTSSKCETFPDIPATG
jgi:hypothetical protein